MGAQPVQQLATLDDDSGVQAEQHILVGSKAIWWELADDLLQHLALSHRCSRIILSPTGSWTRYRKHGGSKRVRKAALASGTSYRSRASRGVDLNRKTSARNEEKIMLDIKKIDHVGIRVSAKTCAISFYELIGFKLITDIGFEKGHPIIMQHNSGIVLNQHVYRINQASS